MQQIKCLSVSLRVPNQLEHVSRMLCDQALLHCLVRVGADITLLREREVDYDSDRNTRKIAEVLVRKVPDDQQVRLCPQVLVSLLCVYKTFSLCSLA